MMKVQKLNPKLIAPPVRDVRPDDDRRAFIWGLCMLWELKKDT